MSRWLHELPVALIALVVVVGVALLVAVVYLVAMRIAASGRREAMQALSPGLLPPLGIVFALIVGFLAAGVWGDSDKARDAVSSEASALRSVVLLSEELPPATAAQMRLLVRRQIDDAVHTEWPAMRDQKANLATVPTPLLDAQRLALSFSPRTPGRSTPSASSSAPSCRRSTPGAKGSSSASPTSTRSSGSGCWCSPR